MGTETGAGTYPANVVDQGLPWRVRAKATAREAVLVFVFYYVYRTIQRLAKVGGVETRAYANAKRVVSIERFVHIFGEQAIQSVFLGARWLIKTMNIYYGTLHFLVTAGILGWMFLKRPWGYLRVRNLLGATTGLALIGYYAFPLTPPRMLVCNATIPAPGPQHTQIIGKCFVDTLARVGGLWSYQSSAVKAVANEFAAMPSLHFGWSVWCAYVVARYASGRWRRWFVVAYPTLTLFAIVVTANHYFLDAVGGAITFWAAVKLMDHLDRRRVAVRPTDEDRAEHPGAAQRLPSNSSA